MRSLGGSFSLPKKTQPTKQSSSCTNLNSQIMMTCPQVSIFRQFNTSKTYVHKLDIDYGHLQEPFSLKNKLIKQNKKPINYDRNAEVQQIDLLKTVRLCFKHRTDKKAQRKNPFKIEKGNIQNMRFNPEQRSKNKRINIKLNQIYALQKSFNGQTKTDVQPLETNKKSIKINTLLNEGQKYQNYIQPKSPIEQLSTIQAHQKVTEFFTETTPDQSIDRTYRKMSSRKVLHSRIVKTYVAGNGMQVKIINYPDSTDYLKLCRTNRINSKENSVRKSTMRI